MSDMVSVDRAALLALKRTGHDECEDCWYSCATITCDDKRKSDKCDCGTDHWNAKIDALIAAAPKPDVDAVVAELDALYEKATKGPLEQREDDDYYQGGLYIGRGPYHYQRQANGLMERVEGRQIGTHAYPLDCYFQTDVARVQSQEDADFIMALVNAYPRLRAALTKEGK